MFERILTIKGTFGGKFISVLLAIVLALSMSNVLAFAQVGSAFAGDEDQSMTGSDDPASENPASGGSADPGDPDDPASDDPDDPADPGDPDDPASGDSENPPSDDPDDPASGDSENPPSDDPDDPASGDAPATSGTIKATSSASDELLEGKGTEANPYIVARGDASIVLQYVGLPKTTPWEIAGGWFVENNAWNEESVSGVAKLVKQYPITLETSSSDGDDKFAPTVISVIVESDAPAGTQFSVRYGERTSCFQVAGAEESEDDSGLTISAEESTPVNEGKITLDIKGSAHLTATTNEDASVTWTSSNENVATVVAATDNANAAVVTGVTEGTATITATTSGNKSAAVTVNVVPHYAITFDANGGDQEAPADIKATCGEQIKLPEYRGTKTTKTTGKEKGEDIPLTFVGWSTDCSANPLDPDVNSVYKPNSEYTVEGPATFYAIWEERNVGAKFYIRIDGKMPEGPGSQETTLYTPEIDKLDKPVIERAAFCFNQNGIDEYLDKNSLPTDGDIAKALGSCNPSIGYNPQTQHVTWYAMKKEGDVWHVDGVVQTIGQFKLTYNSNVTGSEEVLNMPEDNNQCEKDKNVQVPTTAPTRSDGYVFTGWNTQRDGKGVSVAVGGEIYMNENKTLYAQWRKACTVTFDQNNGSVPVNPESESAPKGNTITLPSYNGECAGKEFIGWSENRDATGAVQFLNTVIYPAGASYEVNKDATLFAVWADKNVTAKFFVRLTLNDEPKEPARPSASEYSAGIEIKEVIKVAAFSNSPSDILKNLNRTPTSDEIKDAFGNKKIAVNTADGVKKIDYDPTKHEISWYAIKHEEDSWHVDGVVRNKEDVTLSYVPNALDGVWVPYTMPDAKRYPTGTKATVDKEKTPQRNDGFEFAGWNTKANGTGTAYAKGAEIVMDGDKTLYAQWKPKSNYDVRYLVVPKEGGSTTPQGDFDLTAAEKPTVEKVKGSTAAPSAGYKFVGWYKGETPITTAKTLPAETAVDNINQRNDVTEGSTIYYDTDFTAKFSKDWTQTHKVSYEVRCFKDEGTEPVDKVGPRDSETVWAGEKATVPVAPEDIDKTKYEGYKVAKVELNGQEITIEDIPFEFSTTEAGDANNVIDIYYVLDDGKTKTVTATVDYQLGDDVQIEDHEEISAEVQVLQKGPISTKEVIVKKYSGWELAYITLNDKVVEELPETVIDGDKIVYHYSVEPSTPSVPSVKPETPDPGSEPNPTTTPTDQDPTPGPGPTTTKPDDQTPEPPATPQDPTQEPDPTPTPETPDPTEDPEPTTTPETPELEPAPTPETTPAATPELTPEIASSPTPELNIVPEPVPVRPPANVNVTSRGLTVIPEVVTAAATPNPLTTVEVPFNPLGGTPVSTNAVPQDEPESAIGDEGAPLAAAEPTTIEDGATPLAALMTQETEDGHVGCVVHFYILLGIILSVVYAAAVALRRARFSHLLKNYEDDLTGDGGSSDSPAREKAGYRPEAAALNGIPAMAAVSCE
ncbi:hypothetical protein GMI69_06600 [Eggerthellaceae bacterium zg-887]|uniref:InlB B-repeat-containing protein n=1 Tax=Xiamenia xianingshaonis TaxID=2682776 RepID=UPI00140C2C0D|nr:InlB B-repeat-containing protein [Xiamenia xianingshaonis]NHM16327.1 hypothetical protein [Xiamenia xianingshaonis]